MIMSAIKETEMNSLNQLGLKLFEQNDIKWGTIGLIHLQR